MKRIKRFIITFILLFFVFPCFTNAATELSASTQNPIVGDNLYVQLEANYGQKLNIRDFHVYIEYDPEYFEIVEIKWVKSRTQMGTHEVENGKIYIDKDNADWSSGPVLQVEFTVKKTGSTKVNIVETKPAYYVDGSPIAQTTAGIIINSIEPNTNVELSALYVNGYNMQPAFKKSTLVYNVTVPSDVVEAEIIAKKTDSTQTITGDGIKKLNYGANTFKIVVTAQNKASRTYELTITRTDNRTGDLSLGYLSVSKTSIRYRKGVTEYSATVGRNTNSVIITAHTNDPLATLTGTGEKEVQMGENKFELLVISSDGAQQVYTIKITRLAESVEAPTKSSKLKSLKVNNLVIKLQKDVTTYLYGITNDVTELNIEPTLVSPTATYTITGHEKLKIGINKITIQVTQVLQEAVQETINRPGKDAVTDVTDYILLLYKAPANVLEIESFNQITGEDDYLYITTEGESHFISKNTIKKLNDNKKTLYFNVVNMYTGLLYQVKLPTEMEIKNYNLKVNKSTEGDLTYSTNLPKDSLLTLYLGDQYADETGFKIYSYDDGTGYTLVTEGIEVFEGYIQLKTNGQKYYVLTNRNLTTSTNVNNNLFSDIPTLIIISLTGVIAAILIIKIIKKKKREKESKEPLY